MNEEILERFFDAVRCERIRQDVKWGEQNHADGTGGPVFQGLADAARKRCDEEFRAGRGNWRLILEEEIAEAFAESDPTKLVTELKQCAAVIAAWVEKIQRGGVPIEPRVCIECDGPENYHTNRHAFRPKDLVVGERYQSRDLPVGSRIRLPDDASGFPEFEKKTHDENDRSWWVLKRLPTPVESSQLTLPTIE